MTPLRIAVIEGGPSSEAEVSRASAEGVRAALVLAGHEVVNCALDATLPGVLERLRPDVVFPIVHGAIGEDGCLQGMLEVLGVPYVGSAVLASALACDKVMAKRLFRAARLPVAEEALVERSEDLTAAAQRVRAELGAAVVVKPSGQGSAIGVTRVDALASNDELSRALQIALDFDAVALCERFVVGREITCGVLDTATLGPARALPPTEIFARASGFYDFTSRYAQGGSSHQCPAALPDHVLREVQRVALAAHRALGCRDLSRADFVVGDGSDPARITLLEVNTLPGMTRTSLFPEAAAVDGTAMPELCHALVLGALQRGVRHFGQARALPSAVS